MDIRRPRETTREPFDPRDLEISRLKREVAALRGREESARHEAQDARKHFADLTSMSRRFAHSMRATVVERQQQRRRLAAQYAVGRVLAEARDLDEVAPKVYEILGERLGWQAGVLWKVDEDCGALRLAGCWRSEGSRTGALEAASKGMVFRRGEGLPGRVWERCAPVWVEDVLADEEMLRRTAAAEDGMRGALAFPIFDGGFVGAFELFRREKLPADEDLMRTAGLIGGQIGQFLERLRAEEERDRALVREREVGERTSGILESVNDAFFTLDGERRFTYVNNRAEELWGRAREELLGKSMREVFPQTVGSDPYRAVEKGLREGEAAEFEAVSPVLGIWISGRVYPSDDGVAVLFHSIEERKRAEEALRHNEARWHALMAKGADVITISDRDGTIRFASPSVETVCGYGVEEFVGTNPFEEGRFHPDDLERCREAFHDLAADPGRSVTIEHRYRHASGEWRWLEGTFTNLFDDEAIGGLVANFRDVTDRKGAEEAVRRAAELDAFRVALADALRPLTEPIEIQATACRLLGEHLGVSRAVYGDIEGDKFVLRPGYADGVAPFVGRGPVTDFGEAIVESYRRGETVAVADVRADGRFTEAELAAFEASEISAFAGAMLKKGGRWVGIFGIHSATPRSWRAEELELTEEVAERIWTAVERARAEEALRESEQRYRSLAEATSSIVWTAGRDGACVERMPGWEEFTGQTYREYRGFGWLDALHPKDRPPDNLWEEVSSSNPEPMEGEYRLRHRSGEYRRMALRGVPITDDGETREWVGTLLDVEDARRAEEERERLRREAESERRRLETILRQMPGGVFVAEPSGRLVLASAGAAHIYGKDVGSIEECGRRSLSYPDGEEIPPDEMPLVRSLNGEEVSALERYAARPDGKRRVVRANSAPVRDEGGRVVAAVEAFEDVTRRKEAERERDRSHEREQEARDAAEEAERRLAFYAGAREERQIISRELHDRVAHSIAVVRQNLELFEVLRERNPEAAAVKLELAKEEARATLKSTRDLSMMLRRSEVEGGIARALAGLEETTVPMGVVYESVVAGDETLLPPHVGNQVFLVLREAVRNAASHSGCGRVAVRLETTEEGVIGTVEDDGRGFEPEEARANGGLRSMEERVSLVGGTFRLRSVPDGGTTVEVSVPLGRAGA